MLEHMSPWEYTEVRKVLGHGSGFDSPGFRELRRVAKPLGEAFHAARERAELSLIEVYTRGREFFTLCVFAVAENIGYRQMIAWFRLRGLWNAARRRKTWGVMARVGHAAAADESEIKRAA